MRICQLQLAQRTMTNTGTQKSQTKGHLKRSLVICTPRNNLFCKIPLWQTFENYLYESKLINDHLIQPPDLYKQSLKRQVTALKEASDRVYRASDLSLQVFSLLVPLLVLPRNSWASDQILRRFPANSMWFLNDQRR